MHPLRVFVGIISAVMKIRLRGRSQITSRFRIEEFVTVTRNFLYGKFVTKGRGGRENIVLLRVVIYE